MAVTTLPIVASAAPSTAPAATRSAAPVAAATPNANSTGSQSNGDAAPNDFLAMFAQMINTADGIADNVAPELSSEKAGDKAGDKAEDADAADAMAAAALQPFAAPIQLPTQPAPAVQQKTDVMELIDAQLSVSSGAAQKTIDGLLPETDPRTEKTSARSEAAQAPELTAADVSALSNTSTARTEPPPTTVQIHAPVGSQHWPDQVGAQLTLMAQKGEHTASLKLSPEHLGPVEVRIAVRDDQTTVWFGAQHADTRVAIEQALPRLRELFAAQGMSLGDSGVYREAPRDTPKQFGNSPSGERGSDSASVTAVAAVRAGLVDAYA
jgi:flagellar hook-length control protein FliK